MNTPVSTEDVPELQFQNPDAPNYDWQRDREWFNQRLASERIRNANLHNRIRDLRAALKEIKSPKAKDALIADDIERARHDATS